MDRLQAILTQERALASDSIEMCHVDYSYKPIKAIIAEEKTGYGTGATYDYAAVALWRHAQYGALYQT